MIKRLFKLVTLAGMIGGLSMGLKASRENTECHCTANECTCTSAKRDGSPVSNLVDKVKTVRERLPS